MTDSKAPLFATKHGQVVHCTCCGQIEITFRGERLRLPSSDFDALVATVDQAWHDIQETATPSTRWRLAAATSAGPVSVTFATPEVAALHELLDGASAMMELDAILKDVLAP